MATDIEKKNEQTKLLQEYGQLTLEEETHLLRLQNTRQRKLQVKEQLRLVMQSD